MTKFAVPEVLRVAEAAVDILLLTIGRTDWDDTMRETIRRLDIFPSAATGRAGAARAPELYRLACLHNVLGRYQNSMIWLEASLESSAEYDDYKTNDKIKMLASNYNAMDDSHNAIAEYERALEMENNVTDKARLLNALSHLHLKVGRQSRPAVDYLKKSLKIQNADSQAKDANLKFDTMILLGNAFGIENNISKAIHWYEVALDANPDKNPIHPSNLRALYNKGVAQFRNGDTTSAGGAFGTILNAVEQSSTVAPRSGFILNAIGSIYFANKNYASACEQFLKSLDLNEDELSPCQRALTLCNTAIAHYKLGHHDISDEYFEQALQLSKLAYEESLDIAATLATIMCSYGCILWKRELYFRAYNLFLEGKGYLHES